jgi:hypothetical protein
MRSSVSNAVCSGTAGISKETWCIIDFRYVDVLYSCQDQILLVDDDVHDSPHSDDLITGWNQVFRILVQLVFVVRTKG